MGFGNLLFLALWAHRGRREGDRRYFLRTPVLRPWLDVFPSLADLSLDPADVRFRDQRLMPWGGAARGRAGDFDDARTPLDLGHVQDFVDEVLEPWVPVSRSASDPGRLVVNVRRGDYYSVPEIRGQFGFDVDAYLRIAVPAAIHAHGPPSHVEVVTDGPDWCRARLGWLSEYAEVGYATSGTGPVADFFALARSRRLVITNSTFSYWGAYVSNALYGDNFAQVHAPAFFDRTQNGGRSWMLDPRWSVVEDIPGGWDS